MESSYLPPSYIKINEKNLDKNIGTIITYCLLLKNNV